MILPLPSLHSLVPKALAGMINNSENPLNKFYTSDFQIDPFGAAIDSEYIVRIPFIDEALLEVEYRKIMKSCEISKQEILRNMSGINLLYEWNYKNQEYEVESALPGYFVKFRSKVKMTKLAWEDMPL